MGFWGPLPQWDAGAAHGLGSPMIGAPTRNELLHVRVMHSNLVNLLRPTTIADRPIEKEKYASEPQTTITAQVRTIKVLMIKSRPVARI